MKSVLLYNLCPLNNWEELTLALLSDHNHDKLYIHVSMPLKNYLGFRKKSILDKLAKYTEPTNIFFSKNVRKKGESIGFNKFRTFIDFDSFNIATYIHSKGVSKRKYKSQNVRDWTMMMHYFLIERHDLCKQAFKKGYHLYGCNLMLNSDLDNGAPPLLLKTPFLYSGNFVSINLDILRDRFLSNICAPDYYGPEAFWGKLTKLEKAYIAHKSPISNHYQESYPREMYVIS
ncbi:MAG: hypothetical protein KDK41_04945 [Leptospiraceae bacterium]|nr:hypothetical protein [Leptospiraceae bacterium]